MTIGVSTLVKGEGLETRGFEYRLGTNSLPVVSALGLLTRGFVWNVADIWSPYPRPAGASWVNSFSAVGFTLSSSASWISSWTALSNYPTNTWTLSVF